MPTEQILTLLIAERDRLSRAIEVLQGGVRRRGRPPKSGGGGQPASSADSGSTAGRRRGRRGMNAAQRKAQSERMKAFWAQRRKAKKA